MYIQRRRITANSDVDTDGIDTMGAQVAPEASDLLFEAEDVADLVAEITGEPVEVTADEDEVTFAVGDEEYTATAEGDEEILEATRRPFKGRSRVAASRNGRATRGSRAVRSSRSLRRIPGGRR